MRDQEIIGLWEAYQQVHSQPQEEVEQLDEGMTMKDFKQQRSRQKQKEKRAAEKTSPTRRANMSSYERAVRHRVSVDPDYDRDNEERDYPGGVTKNPKKIRKAKALGELGEGVDLFDIILEHLVAEGYAETNEAALAIMANMSEEWRESIVEEVLDEAIYSEKGKAKAAEMIAKRSTPSGRAKPGKGANVAQIRQIRGSGRGRFDREGLGGTPMTPTMAKNPIKKQNYDGTGNKAARRAAELKNEEVDIFDIILEHLVAEGYAETNEAALAIMANMSEEWRQDIMEISDRKVKAVRNAREKQWNKQFGKNRVQDPTDDMVDKVDKLIDQRNKRTGSNVKKTTLGQLADKSAARIRSKAKDNG